MSGSKRKGRRRKSLNEVALQLRSQQPSQAYKAPRWQSSESIELQLQMLQAQAARHSIRLQGWVFAHLEFDKRVKDPCREFGYLVAIELQSPQLNHVGENIDGKGFQAISLD